MSELSTLEREQLYSIDIYPKRELTVVRGEGAHVYDDTGREFIDCAAGIGVASVGHANPAVAKAVAEQASKLITCPGIFHNDVRAAFLEKLVSVAPKGLEQAFLCSD